MADGRATKIQALKHLPIIRRAKLMILISINLLQIDDGENSLFMDLFLHVAQLSLVGNESYPESHKVRLFRSCWHSRLHLV
jgi:hypothetical protein